MKKLLFTALVLTATSLAAIGSAQDRKPQGPRPTIILVHGAFAESSSWEGIASRLLARGYPVIAAANPLRSVKGDADYVSKIIGSVSGPVVLVGHSYGGAVISEAVKEARNVKALVFVAGFAPEAGESAANISAKFPEGTLGQALAPPVTQADGGKDLYILPAKFWAQFAADVPKSQAALMATAQRPVTEAALNEPLLAPAWRVLPSYFIYGSADRNIPQRAHAFMAQRAKSKQTVEINGASHVVMISHPEQVARMIQSAASSK